MVCSVVLCLATASLLSLAHAEPQYRRVASEYEAMSFQPYEALVKADPAKNLSLGQRHFAHKRARMTRSLEAHHDDRISRNQVQNPRAAVKASEERQKLGRRAAPSAVPCIFPASNYGQCGGQDFSGPKCCQLGWTCNAQSQWYSQCIPAPTDCTNAFSQQCGGIGWTGSTCCPLGSACTRQNDYYYSCQIGATPVVLPASPTTAPATTSSSTTVTIATPTAVCLGSIVSAWGQCGGTGFTSLACCVAGFTCSVSNPYYAQCIPAQVTTTSSSSLPAPTKSCTVGGGGSDGCTPYTVTGQGVTLPPGQTFPANGHVNYQAIPCSQYSPGQSYLKPGSNWTPVGFGVHFDPNNGNVNGQYIGKTSYDWEATSYFGAQGFCIVWVQYSNANQHFGEGGQAPVCSSTCRV